MDHALTALDVLMTAGSWSGPDGPVTVLPAGDVTEGVVRVGETVRRPRQPTSRAVAAYLLHLRAGGFTGAPAFLGTDGQGRDVLEHLPGDVAGQQPEPWAADDALLPTIGTLLHDLHTAATGFEPPAGTLWFRDEHPDPPERDAALGPTTVIGHNDATPQNVVVRAGRAVALIDFDLAGPSTPLREVLIACLHWAPLAEPSDRLVSFADCDAPARCRLLADGYGLVRADRERFVDLAVTSAQVSWHRMREAADLRGGGWARMWAEGVGDVIRRREVWLLRHRDELNNALLGGVTARYRASMAPTSTDQAEGEVVDLCRDLLRIDTSNFGDDSGPGERKAAEFVMEQLTDVGLEPELIEASPGRSSVVLRVEGEDSGRDALLLHGHLDVVPAHAPDWQVDPFSGEERDGCLWGRGAVDMKGMDAMLLSLLRDMARTGRKPARDLVIAFLADEEAGGNAGAHWLVTHRPELFEGVTEAISEVGGFSIDLAGQRCYLLQTAEKGIAWLRLVADGRAGHGSQVNDDNAVTRLAQAVSRIGTHEWPIEITPTVRAFLDGVTEITGVEFDPADPDRLLATLGTTARWVGATLRNTSNPTVLDAGYKHNVIPGRASALIDCRAVGGQEKELMDTIADLAGEGVEVETVYSDNAIEAPQSGALPDAMVAALLAEDPGARVLPYCLSGGTDNKAFARLGVRGYGLAPLRLPADLDFSGMFHGIDERVPTDALTFGVRVLDRLLRTC